jgi:hypothetical protein
MATQQVQLRLSKGLVETIDHFIKEGKYASRSDVVRDAIRHLHIHSMVGIIPNTGDSVKEVRAIRKKLSKQIKSEKDLRKLNKLAY